MYMENDLFFLLDNNYIIYALEEWFFLIKTKSSLWLIGQRR